MKVENEFSERSCWNCALNNPNMCYLILNEDKGERLEKIHKGFCKAWKPIDPYRHIKDSLIRSKEREERFGRRD